MSLFESIQKVLTRKKESARDGYYRAIRAGDAEQTAALAEAAGILPEQVAQDAAILDRAAELRPLAEQLPAVVKARESAVKKAVQAQREFEEAVERLRPLAMQAALAAREAEQAERETRQRANELRILYASNPDLLPADSKPTIIMQLETADAAADAADAAKRSRTSRWLAARERVENAQAALNAIGKPHNFMGMKTSLIGPGEAAIESQTEAALAELAAANAERDAAGEAFDAQGQ